MRKYPARKKRHFVDNEALYLEFVKFKALRRKSLEEGNGEPQIPRKIAEAIILIAERYSTLRNFSFLSFREDMVGDAIELCTRYAKNFDPDRGRHPFAYLSRITYNAFLQRIQKERKQEDMKRHSLDEFILEHGDEAMLYDEVVTAQKNRDQWLIDQEKFRKGKEGK